MTEQINVQMCDINVFVQTLNDFGWNKSETEYETIHTNHNTRYELKMLTFDEKYKLAICWLESVKSLHTV